VLAVAVAGVSTRRDHGSALWQREREEDHYFLGIPTANNHGTTFVTYSSSLAKFTTGYRCKISDNWSLLQCDGNSPVEVKNERTTKTTVTQKSQPRRCYGEGESGRSR